MWSVTTLVLNLSFPYWRLLVFPYFAFIYIWSCVQYLIYEPHISMVEKYSVGNFCSQPDFFQLTQVFERVIVLYLHWFLKHWTVSVRPMWFYCFVAKMLWSRLECASVVLCYKSPCSGLWKVSTDRKWWVLSCAMFQTLDVDLRGLRSPQ